MPCLTELVQRPAVDVVHDKVGPAVRETADVVDLHQPLIMDPPHDARLGEEAVPDIAVGGPVVGQHFHRDGHVQVIVMPEPNGRERAGADAPNQPVPPYGFHRHHSRPSATHLPRDGNLRSHGVLTVCTGCNLCKPSAI